MNIRACIFREITINYGKEDLEKSLYESLTTMNSNTTSINNQKDQDSINCFDLRIGNNSMPLTKENLEMHSKRFENNSKKFQAHSYSK